MIGNGPTYKNHKLRRNHTNYRIGGNYMKTRNLTIAGGCGVTGGLMIFMMMLLALDARGGSHE